ncbi:MAG TPA: MtrB/PioB family decaheme-associated outer membrane protein [Xanthomonadales bacterium]|nr:MtrB/PioB family decaheme-associated outer membrane protein [Xanthomonadales bacterium]
MKTVSIRKQDRPLRARVLCAAIVAALAAAPAAAQEDEFSLGDEPVAEEQDAEALEAKRRALTETRNWVEIGAGWVSDDSFRFGKYNGLEDEGLFPILDFELGRRGAWDSDDTSYWRVAGSDVGLSTRELEYEAGAQGRWSVRAAYDEMQVNRTGDIHTIFTNPGSTALALPGNWVAGQNTATMSRLGESLREHDLEHSRRAITLGFDRDVRERWQFGTDWRHERKEGTKGIGGVIGNSGGNPRAVLLPEPIDYTTDEVDAFVRYADGKAQLQAGYHVSLFRNENEALAWQNPYAAINGWDASAGFPTGQGQMALPPDNQFHQFSVAGGWNFSQRTRFSGDVAFGRMEQDERFLPYTVNPTLAASVTRPLPRSSLDGRIDTTVANFRLSSRPTDRWNWNMLLRYDDRDNRTPRDEYNYIGGDSNTQTLVATSNRRRYNEPYSYQEEKLRFDTGYRVFDRLHLTGSAERRQVERTYSEREEADENTFTIGARSDFTDWIGGGVRLTRADRSGSTYHGNEPFLSGYDPGYTSTVPGQFENAPGLRKYHLADRQRDQGTVYLTVTPNEAWSFGLNTNYVEDDYDESELGLTFSRMHDYTVDVAWMPAERWTAWGFYTYEKLASDQDGQSMGGGTRVADAVNPARSWFADHRDRAKTWGLGLDHRMNEDKVKLGVDYVQSRTTSDVFVSAGTALAFRPLPQDHTRLRALSLRARWQWRPQLAFNVGYQYEKYDSSDWSVDGVEANQLANVILFGEDSPDYKVHVVGVSVTYTY